MWGARATRAGVGGDGVGRLLEVGVGLRKDAVVVDGSDVRVGGGFVLRQEKARREEECCGLRAEDATSDCHGD